MSLVIQSFNHRRNIERIVERVRLTSAEEFIVCEDGSVDGSARAWQAALDRPNDFVIVSNDLHEIRTYNRAISLARGEFVGVMQDDDIPPSDPGWISDVVALFRAHPMLAVVGCWGGWAFNYDDYMDPVLSHVGPGEAYRYAGKFCGEPVNEIPYSDPKTDLPFCFVESVSIGPMFFRRSEFERLGGFSAELSGPGEPGIWLDYELCVRAWLAGHQVGLYASAPFERYVGGQGTFLFGESSRGRNWERNHRLVVTKYGERIGPVRNTIQELNRGLRLRTGPTDSRSSAAAATR